MPIVSARDVNFIKLKSLKKEFLGKFCGKYSIGVSGTVTEIIKKALVAFDSGLLSTEEINRYIKNLHTELREKEIAETGASHDRIVHELDKVDAHHWGMVQGDVDTHIQAHYVRKYLRFDDLAGAMKEKLYDTIHSYVLCTWYNHWSTIFLEDLICANKNVIPLIKKTKGIDIIWNEQPVDIKVTNLPKQWFSDGKTIDDALRDPIAICEYLYRLQGAQRFGADNRLFIIICDREHPMESWKIKRDYALIKKSVDDFFSQNAPLDPIHFSYGSVQHLAHAKVLFIVK